MGMQPDRLRIELVQTYVSDFNASLVDSEEEFDFDKDLIDQALIDSLNAEMKETPDHDLPDIIWTALSEEDIVPEEFHDRFVKFMNESFDDV